MVLIKMDDLLIRRRQRAFTLVEVLIVILIIGVLAGLVMISSFNMQNASKAARIIADMREMKAAAYMYKTDRGTWPIWIYSGGGYCNRDAGNEAILPSNYINGIPVGDGYWIGVMRHPTISSVALVAADVSNLSSSIKEAIVLRSAGIPLMGTETIGAQAPDISSLSKFKASDNGILWLINQ